MDVRLIIFRVLLFSSVWLTGRSEMVAECPPEYVQRGGTSDCYLFHSTSKRNWYDASTYCELENGNLVRIGTSDMADWLIRQIAKTDVSGDSSEFWIDAVYNETTGKWYWASSGSQVNLEYLPEDATPKDGDFGVLTLSATLLGHPSSNQYHFICHRLINEPMFCDYEEGWHMNNDRCYSVSDYKDSWLNSQLSCQQISGDLVTINGQQEQYYVLDEAVRYHDNIWIGMTEINHAGHFYWVGDNSSLFSHWNDSMPKSMDGTASGVVDEENPSGEWMTEVATNQHHFMCERSTGSCVMGWEEHGDSCYYFNRQPVDVVTWHTAYELCANISTHLLVIDSQEEDDFVRGKMAEDEALWIGLYYNATSGAFEWVNDAPYTRNLTHMSQESEDAVQAEGVEKCVSAQYVQAGENYEEEWVPLTCEETHSYVCEVPAGTPVYIHVPPLDQYCPEGWVLDQDACYYISDYEDTWTAGESYCKVQGGHLASITSWVEQDNIHSKLAGDSWIGLNDRVSDFEWEWSDGRSVILYNWAGGEPSGGNENCVEMKVEEGYWNDLTCSELNYFVCKRDYSSTPLAPVTTTTPGPDEGNCGEGWVEDTNSGICYMFVDELLGFADAQLRCHEMRVSDGQSQADLVSLSNVDEQLFVQDLVAEAHVQDDGVYIGLRNEYSSQQLYWTDAEPIGLLNYVDGAPFWFSEYSCSKMFNDGEYKWTDCLCSERIPFVCEKKGPTYQTPTPPSALASDCPDGWTLYSDYCYFRGTDYVTWEDANAACSSLYGSTLTSILDEDENQFLHDMMYDNYNNFWLGMRADEDGSYKTWLDGNAVVYANWLPGEPNDQNGLESCVEMLVAYYGGPDGEGTWNDMKCNKTQNYVCKTRFKTCPEGWSQHDGKCYHVGEDQRSWSGALDACKEADGEAHLLSWHSQEEEDYVQGLINDTFGLTWLGLYHNDGEAWQWEDGTDTDFINWRPGQPDYNDTEFCGLTVSNPDDSGYGLIENYPCNNSNYFACEYFPTHTIGCDPDWDYFGGFCYYRSSQIDETAYFDVAREKCMAMDGDLASIWTAEENDFLMSLVQDGPDEYHHIGLQFSDADRTFSWTDGSPVLFTDLPGLYTSLWNDDCFFISSSSTTWDRFSCMSWPYFCKKAATLTNLQPVVSGCYSSDHLYHGDSCYVKLTSSVDYKTASQHCTDSFQNSHLVSIQNQVEEAFLSAHLPALGEQIWIGLQENVASDGTVNFKWDDGSDFTFASWGQYEPRTDVGECTYISGAQTTLGLWYVTDCVNTFPALCEYPREGYTTEGPPVTTVGAAVCTAGWSLYTSTQSCYKVMTTPRPQGLAEQSCVQFGGHLVSLHSEQEETFLKKLIDRPSLNTSSFWTGLTVTGENDFAWLDGSLTDYLHWANNQPESHDLRDTCVSAWVDSLEWYDSYCDAYLPYVCKAPQGTIIQSTAQPITSAPDVPCPDFPDDPKWLQDGDSCYRIFSQIEVKTESWREARKLCEKLGASLVSILSKEENSFLLSKVYQYPDDSLWTGGYADYDGGFKWSDGEPFDYFHWDDGEPNNMLDQESCIALYPQKFGYWNDANCAASKGYVCKKPVGGTAAPLTTAPPASGHCPAGWLHAGGKCVQLMTERLGFDDARQRCRDIGTAGDLVSIHGPEMQAAVTVIMTEKDDSAWIGLRMSGGVFKWVDQTDFTYDHWDAGEPNGGDGENGCVAAQRLSGAWEDVDCLQNRTFICAQNPNADLSTDAPPPRCSSPLDQYLNYSGACYRPVAEAHSWQEAEDFCAGEGTHLVSVESVAENAFVYGVALEAGMGDVWLGLNSLQDPNQYHWSDTFPVLYSQWGSNQPNTSDTDARCVMLSTAQGGTWYNAPCTGQKSYFCKYTSELIPTADPPVDGNCPSVQWQDFGGGYCYLLVTDDVKSWNDASITCNQEGGALASIHSQEEQDLIQRATEYYAKNLWIGLIETSGQEFGWTDGTALDFAHWADGEPSSDVELCVEMYDTKQRFWNDIDCNNKNAFVCKAAKVNGEAGTENTLPPLGTTNKPGVKNPNGLSGGAIAAIVIACLALVAVAGVVSYYHRHSIGEMLGSIRSSTVGRDPEGFTNPTVQLRDEGTKAEGDDSVA